LHSIRHSQGGLPPCIGSAQHVLHFGRRKMSGNRAGLWEHRVPWEICLVYGEPVSLAVNQALSRRILRFRLASGAGSAADLFWGVGAGRMRCRVAADSVHAHACPLSLMLRYGPIHSVALQLIHPLVDSRVLIQCHLLVILHELGRIPRSCSLHARHVGHILEGMRGWRHGARSGYARSCWESSKIVMSRGIRLRMRIAVALLRLRYADRARGALISDGREIRRSLGITKISDYEMDCLLIGGSQLCMVGQHERASDSRRDGLTVSAPNTSNSEVLSW
jgi:hypothetical protein